GPWGRVAAKVGRLFPIAILGLFGSGAYMTSDLWTWDTGWIEVGIAALVVLAIQGPVVAERSGKKVAQALMAHRPGELRGGAIRRSRRCTLRTVATRSGLSESFLSQVERGQSSASIASLRRIADALGVSIADLFEVDAMPGPRVLRRDERPALAFGVLGRKLLLTPRPLQSLEVFVGELEVGGSTGHQPYAHGDSE